MLQPGNIAPNFSLLKAGRKSKDSGSRDRGLTLLVFVETDCPSCRLALPYLNKLNTVLGVENRAVIAVSQDGEDATAELIQKLSLGFPVVVDHDLSISRLFDPQFVPTTFLVDGDGRISRADVGFEKTAINEIAKAMFSASGMASTTVADPYDGAPAAKPGCSSRHLEGEIAGERGSIAPALNLSVARGPRASKIVLQRDVDAFQYCIDVGFADPLPVIPPTVERVERMLAGTNLEPDQVVALIPPNYGMATVEKIAANAVMAGCVPEMMRVLVPLVRAVTDERFNIHGVQATTHFAAPLVIVNGPVRKELGFVSASNAFSNVGRANSTLGRALQLVLTNLGGARPGEIDMSTLGNPGKFSYCIAENEEENPWEPFHVEHGFRSDQSTVTLFAAEPPKGVSEHNARKSGDILKAICRELATCWTYLFCGMAEAIVVLCPEHVKTINSDGLSKQEVRKFLFENTGIPLKAYEHAAGAEGTQFIPHYQETTIDGEPCYRKFRSEEAIKIVVAGGTAGKFSAVISSWATGPRGSQMVTYPIE
ncbi:MAG: peroxiredoxin family protein [Blastocatellia bacterium]